MSKIDFMLINRFKQYLGKIKNNLLLALLALSCIFLQQKLFYSFTPHNPPNLNFEKWSVLFFALFMATFIKKKWASTFVLSFIPTLNLAQMLHLQYMGSRVFPAEFGLLFSQMGEIWGTIGGEAHHNLFIVLLGFFPLLLIYRWPHHRWKMSSLPFIGLLFLLYFFYNPIRTLMTGNTWGRQPSTREFDGLNVYTSLSYYMGRILPLRWNGSKAFSALTPLEFFPRFENTNFFDGSVIFVMGESLTPYQMSLFNPLLKTTPFLEQIKDEGNFHYKFGYSAAVSSDVSVALLFNNTFGVGSSHRVSNGNTCLFQFAKENNFSTYYFSSQSRHHLRYIFNTLCPHQIEHKKIWEDLNESSNSDEDASDDLWLLNYLPTLKGKQFIVLHQRGGHSPYHKRYLSEDLIYPIEGSVQDQKLAHYRNSVRRFDRFMEALIHKVKSSEQPVLIVYVSDHGEGFGEEGGTYGHGTLKKVAAEIPILFYVHNSPEWNEKLKNMPDQPTHLNVSLFVSELLGKKSDVTWDKVMNPYIILGNDIDGFAGGMIFNFKNNLYEKHQIINDL